MTNRYVAIITEIEEQKAALQSIIDAKKAEHEALHQEIPELEAQLANMTELYTNAQLLQATQQQSAAPNNIVYTNSTTVQLITRSTRNYQPMCELLAAIALVGLVQTGPDTYQLQILDDSGLIQEYVLQKME